jgi:hypothetical protein
MEMTRGVGAASPDILDEEALVNRSSEVTAVMYVNI